MRLTVILSLVLHGVLAISLAASADEPVTLMGTIVKWRYPDAEIGESEMSDAATIDADGSRTVPSTVMKTTMVTPASVDDVLEFYRGLLTRSAADEKKFGLGPTVGRSVVFSDESGGRPLKLHVILVNRENSSTTLVVTRGEGEELTHITWKQYLRHNVGGSD